MAIAEETGKASGLARHAERVAKLCSFAERRAGTDAERRAAAWIADEAPTAVGGGARAAIEPTYVHPQWPAVGFAHCLLAIVGSLLAGVSPIAAFAIVFVAAVSFYLDLSGPLVPAALAALLPPRLPERDRAAAAGRSRAGRG